MKLFLVLLGLACSLTGCASSPDPIFYALSSRAGNALQSQPIRIELRRTGLPSYLASARRRGSRGAPLQEMVGATLADDLSERLPDCAVYSDTGSISAPADARVEVEVSRFELADEGSVKLFGQPAVSWTTAPGVDLAHVFLRYDAGSSANGTPQAERASRELAHGGPRDQ